MHFHARMLISFRLDVEGRAHFTRGLSASNVSSYQDNSMYIQSGREIVIESTRGQSSSTASMTVGQESIDLLANSFTMGSRSMSYLEASRGVLQVSTQVAYCILSPLSSSTLLIHSSTRPVSVLRVASKHPASPTSGLIEKMWRSKL